MKTGLDVRNIYKNLIFTADHRVYAYYRLREWNNSYITDRQKEANRQRLERVLEQSNVPDFQMLQIYIEDSIDSIQEKGKAYVKGEIQEFSRRLIDSQTEVLKKKYGKNKTDYGHYIGLRIDLPRDLSFKGMVEELQRYFLSFQSSVMYELMGDYFMIPGKEIKEFLMAEQVLYKRLGRKIGLERIDASDYGYIIEHLLGMRGISYGDYQYSMLLKEWKGDYYQRQVDIKRLSSVQMEEKGRELVVDRPEGTCYMAFLALAAMTESLLFPDCEVLFFQKSELSFPVDVSIRAEVVGHKKAVKDLENKKKEFKDQIDNAHKNGEEADDDVYFAVAESDVLKAELKHKRSNMYKVNMLFRVAAESQEELDMRCVELIDYYDAYGMKLIRSFGDSKPFLEEIFPCGSVKRRDYIQPTKADFLSALGFGGTTKLGDDSGIYIGYDVSSGKPVYIRPDLAARKESKGATTNSMSVSFTGATGWGKSMSSNLILVWIGMMGGRVLIIDPKSERSGWVDSFPEIKEQINLINLESDESNRGRLDPYVLLQQKEDSEVAAVNLLCYLTGVKPANKKEFTILQKAVRKISDMEFRGLACVIPVLKEQIGGEIAVDLAESIEAFSKLGIAKLLFSDGRSVRRDMTVDKAINILQVSGLSLPDSSLPEGEYLPEHILSIACMQVIGAFGMEFLSSDKTIFKVLGADESWSIFGGRNSVSLDQKGVRMGRSLNSGIYFSSQGIDDVGDKNIKNNIGMRFAFHMEDSDEIERTLEYFGLDAKDPSLQSVLRNLKSGEALMKDIWGHVGVVQFDMTFREFFEMFDTSTDRQKDQEGGRK